VTGIPLTAEQRQTVLDLLENSSEITFKKISKALGLADYIGFNLQRGGDTKLKGNLTTLIWLKFSPSAGQKCLRRKRSRSSRIGGPLTRRLAHSRAIEYWNLDESSAKWLASRPAPNGYCMYSRKSIRKLLPLMATGARFRAAEKEVYGIRLTGGLVMIVFRRFATP